MTINPQPDNLASPTSHQMLAKRLREHRNRFCFPSPNIIRSNIASGILQISQKSLRCRNLSGLFSINRSEWFYKDELMVDGASARWGSCYHWGHEGRTWKDLPLNKLHNVCKDACGQMYQIKSINIFGRNRGHRRHGTMIALTRRSGLSGIRYWGKVVDVLRPSTTSRLNFYPCLPMKRMQHSAPWILAERACGIR